MLHRIHFVLFFSFVVIPLRSVLCASMIYYVFQKDTKLRAGYSSCLIDINTAQNFLWVQSTGVTDTVECSSAFSMSCCFLTLHKYCVAVCRSTFCCISTSFDKKDQTSLLEFQLIHQNYCFSFFHQRPSLSSQRQFDHFQK